jgi:hypothetical protein
MTRLNVRCCCQPAKILGTMEVPAPISERGGFFQIVLRSQWLLTGDPQPSSADNIQTLEVRRIDLCCFTDEVLLYAAVPLPRETELAVYAEERPIEFWRAVPGFREGDEVGRRDCRTRSGGAQEL